MINGQFYNQNILVWNKDSKLIYKLANMKEMGSTEVAFEVNLELICGWEYIDDWGDAMGWGSPEFFTEDAHDEYITFYPLHETLVEALEAGDFELCPYKLEELVIHEWDFD